jgi:hypothetical protein
MSERFRSIRDLLTLLLRLETALAKSHVLVLFQPYVLFAITLSLDTLVYIPMAVCF